MKSIISISKLLLIYVSATLSLLSCEDFHENNGDFGGMWQLVEWRTTRPSTGEIDSIAATNKDGFYYSIHQELIQFTHIRNTEVSVSEDYRNPTTFYGRFYAYFKRTDTTLTIYNVVNVNDEPREPKDLAKFGVPADGIFKIENLDNQIMMLSYEGNVLFFRKY